jgi:glycosyltransferase involved in cell wall biosynthesis
VCLKQLDFVDEIIILDQNSQDKTCELAQKYTKKIFKTESQAFDENRNTLAKMAKSDWLFYLDVDERIEKEAKIEIKKAIAEAKYQAYYFPRKNIIFGKWLKHTGFWPDYVPRLFKHNKLISWQGRVHESPKIDGKFGYLKTPILHLTARNLSAMFSKTIRWAKVEAQLSYEVKHPKVTRLMITKAIISEFLGRFFIKKGFMDGVIGLIESIYQAFHRVIVLTYLWELQNDVKIKSKKFQYQ